MGAGEVCGGQATNAFRVAVPVMDMRVTVLVLTHLRLMANEGLWGILSPTHPRNVLGTDSFNKKRR